MESSGSHSKSHLKVWVWPFSIFGNVKLLQTHSGDLQQKCIFLSSPHIFAFKSAYHSQS
jgi:hypothetical protein